MIRTLAVIAVGAIVLAAAACSTNPATGGHNVVFTSVKGEQEQAKRVHLQIIQFYGLYEDQAVQDYVQSVGARVAAQTPIANWNFQFFVLDDDQVNAFTPGGGYVYIHRGLMNYLSTEAELASVLGHEIGHDVARHPARAQSRGVLMSVGAVAAAVASGSEAIAQMANIGATAWMQGYGRDNEMEADRLGLEYAARAGYRPAAMAEVFKVGLKRTRSSLVCALISDRGPCISRKPPAPDLVSIRCGLIRNPALYVWVATSASSISWVVLPHDREKVRARRSSHGAQVAAARPQRHDRTVRRGHLLDQ